MRYSVLVDRRGSQKYVLAEQIYEQLDVKVKGSGPASAVWETLIWKKRK